MPQSVHLSEKHKAGNESLCVSIVSKEILVSFVVWFAVHLRSDQSKKHANAKNKAKQVTIIVNKKYTSYLWYMFLGLVVVYLAYIITKQHTRFCSVTYRRAIVLPPFAMWVQFKHQYGHRDHKYCTHKYWYFQHIWWRRGQRQLSLVFQYFINGWTKGKYISRDQIGSIISQTHCW